MSTPYNYVNLRRTNTKLSSEHLLGNVARRINLFNRRGGFGAAYGINPVPPSLKFIAHIV